MYPGMMPGFFMSDFDMAHKIVVDTDVPEGAPVLDFLLSNVDAVNEPQEGRAVQFLQFAVFQNQFHPLLNIIRLLLVRFQFARQMRPLFQLLGAFGFMREFQ